MDIMIDKGCGLDVHKGTVVVCIMGTGIKKEVKTYATMTNDLLGLKKWLREAGITHVAMESTGIYWKPVLNILEDSFENHPGECSPCEEWTWEKDRRPRQ